MPAKKPRPIERKSVSRSRQNSAKLGKSRPTLAARWVPATIRAPWVNTSATANSPRISGMKWIPAKR
jgi:hypothetical protein